MWNNLKELSGNLLLIFLGLFYLAHFIAFLIIGTVTVGESNRIILGIEIAIFVGIPALGVERLIKDIIRMRRKE